MSSVEIIYFVGLGVGKLRLRRDLVTRERLGELFALQEGPVLVLSSDGDEMQIEQLQTGHTYTVASEEDLRDDSLYFKEPQEITSEERQAMGEILSQRIFLMQQARVALIGQYYTPKHAHLYEFNPQAILCPEIQLAFDKNLDSVLSLLHKESPTGIYSFNLFTEQFCKELVEEIEQ